MLLQQGQRRPVLEANRAAANAPGGGLPLRIRAYVSAAWLLLFLERLLPALLPAALVAGTCLAAALFGLPRLLPAWPQLILLILCGLGFLASLWYGFRGFRWPSSGEAVRRVESDSGFTHRPITHLTDAQASNLIDPDSISLWKSYRQRLIASIGIPFLGFPRGTVAAKDPWGLRALVLLVLVIAVFVAGDSWQKRIIQAVHPNFSAFAQSETSKVEAWLTPPDYTRMAPISLSSAVQLESGEASPLTVPAGSKLLAQAEGIGAKASLLANGTSKDFEMLDAITQRIEGKIQSGDEIAIEADGDTLARWPIKVVPDQAPTVAFATDPSPTDRGVLRLDYVAKDDYGVNNVKAVIQLANTKESLELNLPIPQIDAREMKAYSYQDLTAHPWSGLEVEIRLVARDALGQIGASAPVTITLPERKFYHPVARAIIEQRKKLARDPDSKDAVAEALRGLNAQPEAYDGNVAVFLSLNLAWRRLSADALSKEDLAKIEQQLWDTALALEDGGVSLAMRELRDLQRQLEEALNNGASQEEIERLMNQVQEAMNKYLENMRQQLQEAMKNGMQMQRLSPNGLKLSQQDLNQMLNDARKMAQSGSRESAKQMLDRLQQMLENLQAGIPMPMGQQGNQAQQMMNDMGRMMQRQDKLLQDSFNMQRGQQGQQGEGQQQMNGQPQAGQQEGLRKDFGQLMRDFGNMTGDMPQSMGQAEQSMRRAVDALNKGDFDGASEAQNQALSQMQQSMQQMQQQMQKQAGMNRGPGQRDPMDPFGRTTPREDSAGGNSVNTTGVKVPDQSEMERARQIFEELRERRNDPARPRDERDYLDRLLKQF
ncbi:TIGR02302 family protein [Dongia sedimenti]|uniref:TIGR02302 family protein n=1 Tax=Dongia sedimenti TaxID=3064282 RepID=A0ABU0YG33_9PROT|nr:TIGR02302 family protein [Rhodospirillaceae bacterium R-7]